ICQNSPRSFVASTSHSQSIHFKQKGEKIMARVRFVLVVILFSTIPIFAGGVTAAHGINCGDVLGPGGNFKLQRDLDCTLENPALTVTDGAILDLDGHIVTCARGCVELTGAGAQLLNGVLHGGLILTLAVSGTGGHTVKNVTSHGSDLNINVTS